MRPASGEKVTPSDVVIVANCSVKKMTPVFGTLSACEHLATENGGV
jgi:hypothetical protein